MPADRSGVHGLVTPTSDPLTAAAVHGQRLCDIAHEVPLVEPDTALAVADRFFADDPTLTALIVRMDLGPRLLSRSFVSWKLSGRYGYGRALHAAAPVSTFAATAEDAVSGDLSLVEAAAVVLSRPAARRYDDLLVATAHGPRVASVAALLEKVSMLFRHVALHDALTGLPNRFMLEERGAALQAAGQAEEVAALYIDLDGFKTVNDTYGHRTGDDLLAAFADRLRCAVRPGDLIARLGGDEFAVVVIDVDADAATAVAERIVLLAAAPFVIDGHVLHLSASVGIAMLSDTGREAGLSGLDVLLRDSDAAMLAAKRSGKNRFCRLPAAGDAATPSLARCTRVRQRLQLAIADAAFEIHYQPKYDLASGAMSGVEALLRWTDDELGTVSPAEFIPVAEQSGQIVRLGRWVLERACRQAAVWRREGMRRQIAVNISPVQLRSVSFVDEVLSALAEHDLPASDLRIEVTETSAIEDLPRAITQLGRLRAAGIAVDLDDFGTGFSSLAMLRDLPLSAVKIDKHFVERLDSSAADEYLVRGVIETAHALGLAVTAEGVERSAQLRRLRRLGCDTVQGYLTGRPAPAHAVHDSTLETDDHVEVAS